MRKVVFLIALMLPFLILFAGCGGNDELAPSSTLSDAPDTIFFNNVNAATTSDRVRFSGTASDNFSIFQVQISFDNGVTWKDTTVSGTGSSKTWTYLAKESETSVASTIRTRAQDNAGNWEIPGTGTGYSRTSSSTIATLQGVVTSATSGDVIYLSSGTGGAYGDTSTSIVLANTVDLTIVGSGYGQALTTSSFSAVDVTPTTSMAATTTAARIFSVGANLALKNLRVRGSINAVDISDVAGTLTLEDLVFNYAKAWAIYAEDTNAADSTALYISADNVMVDAGSTDQALLRGGIHMGGQDIDFLVKNTLVTGLLILTSSEEGGGIFVDNSDGQIDSSEFTGNAVGIWLKNSSATVSSTSVFGGINTNSNGVRLSGAAGSPVFRRNSIESNEGYGVRIGGGNTPKFFRNSISGNKLTGVFIEYTGAEAGLLNINLGKTTDATSGFNNLTSNGNNHPVYVPNQVYVSSTTTGTLLLNIPAQNNWWGIVGSGIDLWIIDDDEQGGNTPPVTFTPPTAVSN